MKIKISFNSPVILSFIGLCFIVMILNTITNGKTSELFVTWHSPLNSPLTYLQLLIHVVGHFDWGHFFNNMIYLLLLGPMLEEKYGSSKLIVVILITALVTGLVNYIFFWNVVLCGASGICFSFIVLASFTRIKEHEILITFIIVAAIFIGQQVHQGLMYDDNISNLSHIIGGIIGAITGYTLNKQKNNFSF